MQFGSTGYGGIPYGGNTSDVVVAGSFSASVFDAITITDSVTKARYPLFGLEDVEAGSLPASFQSAVVGFGAGAIAADATSKVNDTYSISFTSTGETAVYAQSNLGEEYIELYFKFWGFFPSGWAFGASSYTGFFQVLNDALGEVMLGNIEDYGSIRLTLNNATLGYTDTGIDLPTNSVFSIQFHIIKNASTGRVRVWLNNDVEGSPDFDTGNVNTGADGMQYARFGKTYAPEACTIYYLDDFTIDDSFIGGVSTTFTASVFDSISITENVTLEKTTFVSTSEAITITEDVTRLLTQFASPFDAIAITENVTQVLVLNVSTFDAIAITESANATLTVTNSVFDLITITESVSTDVSTFASVSDNLLITENVNQAISLETSVFDAISITEGVTTEVSTTINTFEALTITEDVSLQNNAFVSTFDAIGITEFTDPEQVYLISVFDAVGITENVTIDLTLSQSVSDAISITENISLIKTILQNAFDAIAIAESTTTEVNTTQSVFDAIAITENVTVTLQSFTSVFEALGITESISTQFTTSQSVFDAVGITENTTLEKNIFASLVDNLSITENTALQNNLFISVFDAIGITEDVALQAGVDNFTQSVFDAITITENFAIDLSIFLASFENVSITENIATETTYQLSTFDSIAISESESVSFGGGGLEISVFDIVSITEANIVTTASYTGCEIYDEGGLFILDENGLPLYADGCAPSGTFARAVSDVLTITESVLVSDLFSLFIDVFDTIVIIEAKALTKSIASGCDILDELGMPILNENGHPMSEEGCVPITGCEILDEDGDFILDEFGQYIYADGCVQLNICSCEILDEDGDFILDEFGQYIYASGCVPQNQRDISVSDIITISDIVLGIETIQFVYSPKQYRPQGKLGLVIPRGTGTSQVDTLYGGATTQSRYQGTVTSK